jgi:hypothetical protein
MRGKPLLEAAFLAASFRKIEAEVLGCPGVDFGRDPPEVAVGVGVVERGTGRRSGEKRVNTSSVRS